MVRVFLIVLAIGGLVLGIGVAFWWLSAVRHRQPTRTGMAGGGGRGNRAVARREGASPTRDAGTAADADGDEDDAGLLDLQNVEGRMQRSRVRKVGQVVNQHPEEAASVLKRWLHEGDRTE